MQHYRMGYFMQRMTIEMQLAGIVATLSLILLIAIQNTFARLGFLVLFAVTLTALRAGLRREVTLDEHKNLHIGRYDDFIQDPILTPFYSKWLGQPYFYLNTRSIHSIERLSAQAQVQGADRTCTALMRAWLLQKKNGVLITLSDSAKSPLFSKDEHNEIKQIALSVTEPDRFISDVKAAIPRR